jgi:phosphomannomutase
MIANIVADLKSQGASLEGYLESIWAQYGLHRTEQISIRVSNLSRLGTVMSSIRAHRPTTIAGFAVERFDDLALATSTMPATDGLRFYLANNLRIIIRPSGTEPKLKCYIEVVRPTASQSDRLEAERIIAALTPELKALLS